MILTKKYLIILICFCIGLNTNLLAQVNLSQGQKLYFNFNGNANDVSGNNNNGVVNGASLVSDKWGNPNGAYRFDGIDDFIQIAHSNSLAFSADEFTMYALINVKGFYQGQCHGNFIVGKGTSETSPGAMSLAYVDGYITSWTHCNNSVVNNSQNFYTSTPGGVVSNIPSPIYLSTNTWHCVIGVVDKDTIRTYMDGNLCFESIRSSWSSVVNTNDFFIGKFNNNLFPFYTNAVIDEVRVYDRAINSDEIAALCNYSNFPESTQDYFRRNHKAQVYPNPSIGVLYIKSKKDKFTGECILRDLSGKIVKREMVSLKPNQSYSLDIASINKGIYFLNLRSKEHSEIHKLILE